MVQASSLYMRHTMMPPQDAADQATVEAHTALVGGKDLERVGPIVAIAVKDDVKQARANNEAKDRADHDARPGHQS